MPRVLHLCDIDCDYQTRVSIGLLQKQAGHAVRTLGRGGDYSTSLISFLNIRTAAADFDTIHAWGIGALVLASATRSQKIIFSPTRFPNRSDVRWLRAACTYRDVTVVCPTSVMRRYLMRHGVPAAAVRLIVPGVDSARLKGKRDDAVRERLGVTPDDFVIFACGESMHGSNHHAAILTVCVMNVFEPRHKLLLWGRGPLANKEIDYSNLMWPASFAKTASRKLGKDVELEEFLPAVDAVLVTADEPVPTLSLATCMAAGLPIVAALTPTISELLEDRRNALLIGECRSRKLAKRLLDLHDDPQLTWKIADGARNDAYQLFSATRFVEQMQDVYRGRMSEMTGATGGSA